MNPTKWGYAGLVFVVSVLMGYILIEIGLVAVAVLHSVVDVLSLVVLRNEARRETFICSTALPNTAAPPP